MNYRLNGKNLKRSEIREIKREEAEERNEEYQELSLAEKKSRNSTKVNTELELRHG